MYLEKLTPHMNWCLQFGKNYHSHDDPHFHTWVMYMHDNPEMDEDTEYFIKHKISNLDRQLMNKIFWEYKFSNFMKRPA